MLLYTPHMAFLQSLFVVFCLFNFSSSRVLPSQPISSRIKRQVTHNPFATLRTPTTPLTTDGAGAAHQAPQQQQNSNPFGNFYGDLNVNQQESFDTIGSGYNKGNNVAAGWPGGVAVSNGWDANGVGRTYAQQRDMFGYRPDNLGTHNFGTQKSTSSFNTGFDQGVTGQAGVNGFDIHDGFAVPVLGQNPVQQSTNTNLDISKLNVGVGKEGTYGPIDISQTQFGMGSPSLGNLIQRAAWDKVFREKTGQGIPGGVWQEGLANVPFAG